MDLASPRVGAIIRYSYLWADESETGRDEGRKDRPALVLALALRTVAGDVQVLVLAITHSPPTATGEAIALPASVKRSIGLDNVSSWIVTHEANAFVWPGPDIRPVPGRLPPTPIYGHIPQSLLKRVARSYLDNRARQLARTVIRSDR